MTARASVFRVCIVVAALAAGCGSNGGNGATGSGGAGLGSMTSSGGQGGRAGTGASGGNGGRSGSGVAGHGGTAGVIGGAAGDGGEAGASSGGRGGTAGGGGHAGGGGRAGAGAAGRSGNGGMGAGGSAGAGPVTCGGLLGQTCDVNEWCHFNNGSCGAADQTGTCELRQIGGGSCMPGVVCGCDGKTYMNLCSAHQAGMDTMPTTTCIPGNGSSGAPCAADNDCATGFKCCVAGGAVGSPIACRQVPSGGQCPALP
jgi:hypothetical protein